MADFWHEGVNWAGSKVIDGEIYRLEESEDRSFAETHSYVWRTKDGRRMQHLTDDERARITE